MLPLASHRCASMLAVLSDIHANLPALQACLQHARACGAQRLAFAGDLVGYGGDPHAVVKCIRELTDSAYMAVAVRGNHDQAAGLEVDAHGSSDAEGQSASWTRKQLSAEHRRWLGALPLWRTLEPDLLLVHASAADPAAWTYVDRPQRASISLQAARQLAPRVRGVLCGHVHQPLLFHPGRDGHWLRFDPQPGVALRLPQTRPWVACCGSVGQPRDGDPRATYLLLDPQAHTLCVQRVDYDIAAAMHAILAQGGDPAQAERLLEGR